MSLRAISWLKQKKIPFEVVHCKNEEKGAEFAALPCRVRPLVG